MAQRSTRNRTKAATGGQTRGRKASTSTTGTKRTGTRAKTAGTSSTRSSSNFTQMPMPLQKSLRAWALKSAASEANASTGGSS
jgi:hypothetical protein